MGGRKGRSSRGGCRTLVVARFGGPHMIELDDVDAVRKRVREVVVRASSKLMQHE
jgi:hypothetical protein